uniref:Uncharacterized protein n=1 Tax=Anopheles merus TaxID=30066 RepID=A0A182VPK1_ANOME
MILYSMYTWVALNCLWLLPAARDRCLSADLCRYFRILLPPVVLLRLVHQHVVQQVPVVGLVGQQRRVRVAPELQHRPLPVPARVLLGGFVHTRGGNLVLLEPGHQHLEQFVHQLLLQQPVVGHLHRRLVAVAVPDRVRDEPLRVAARLVRPLVVEFDALVLHQCRHRFAQLGQPALRSVDVFEVAVPRSDRNSQLRHQLRYFRLIHREWIDAKALYLIRENAPISRHSVLLLLNQNTPHFFRPAHGPR